MLIERKQPPLPTRLVARLSWARTARADRAQARRRCRRGWWPGCHGLERRVLIERKHEQTCARTARADRSKVPKKEPQRKIANVDSGLLSRINHQFAINSKDATRPRNDRNGERSSAARAAMLIESKWRTIQCSSCG